MTNHPPLVIIGRLGSVYGLHGWQHIESYTQPVENILSYPQWHVGHEGAWKIYTLAEGRVHGKGLVAHLQGVDDPNAAALLTQSYIAIEKEALPALEADEYYWADLEGLTVQSPEGKIFGTIKGLYDNAGVDIMVIQGIDGKEIQIPFILHDTVVAVQLAEKRVIVDWAIETL